MKKCMVLLLLFSVSLFAMEETSNNSDDDSFNVIQEQDHGGSPDDTDALMKYVIQCRLVMRNSKKAERLRSIQREDPETYIELCNKLLILTNSNKSPNKKYGREAIRADFHTQILQTIELYKLAKKIEALTAELEQKTEELNKVNQEKVELSKKVPELKKKNKHCSII